MIDVRVLVGLALAGAFPLVSSCGPATDDDVGVALDTRGVAAETPAAPQLADPAPAPEERSGVTFHGFTGGGRWAIFATGESVVVHDALTRQATTLPGAPLLDPGGFGGAMAQFEIPSGLPRQVARTSKNGRLLLVRDGRGVHAIDLAATTERDRVVATFPGRTRGVSFGDGDRVLQVWTEQEAHFIDLTTGARRTITLPIGDDEPGFTWNAQTLHVGVSGTTHVLDRDTLEEWPMPAGAHLLRTSKDGSYVFRRAGLVDHEARAPEGRASVLEVWPAKAQAPSVRVNAPEDATDIYIDAHWLVWARDTREQPRVFHIVARTDGRETTVSGVGTCPISAEWIVGIDDREVKTDVTCNPGCPSIPYQEQFIVYDRRTGKELRRESGPYEAPVTETWSRELARLEEQTARLGTLKTVALESPVTKGLYVFRTDDALVVGDGTTGRSRVELEGSEQMEQPSFSNDGVLIAATAKDGASGGVWNVRTGRRVFRATSSSR